MYLQPNIGVTIATYPNRSINHYRCTGLKYPEQATGLGLKVVIYRTISIRGKARVQVGHNGESIIAFKPAPVKTPKKGIIYSAYNILNLTIKY
jgi:hypothetical protein